MTRRFQPAARLLVAACLLTALAAPAAAAQLSWYGNGAELGGGGTWNTTSPDWSANGVHVRSVEQQRQQRRNVRFRQRRRTGLRQRRCADYRREPDFQRQRVPVYSSGGNALTLIGSASIDVAAGSQAGISTALAGSAGMTLSGGGELLLGFHQFLHRPHDGLRRLPAIGRLQRADQREPADLDGGVIELAAGDLALGAGNGREPSPASPPTAAGSRPPMRTTRESGQPVRRR